MHARTRAHMHARTHARAFHPELVDVTASILAGMLDSVCLTRALFKRRLDQAAIKSTLALNTYVDDCAQTGQGKDILLATTAGKDGARLVKALADLGGEISTEKSVIVASSSALARAVANTIANRTGLQIKTGAVTEDLGNLTFVRLVWVIIIGRVHPKVRTEQADC